MADVSPLSVHWGRHIVEQFNVNKY